MNELQIEPARENDQAQALWLVLADHPEAGRAAVVAEQMNAARRGTVSFTGLLAAKRGQRVVGAAWTYVAAGGVGVVWPPQLLNDEPETTADGLLAQVDAFLRNARISLAQALLPHEQSASAERLERAQFERAANLVYLSSSREQMPTLEPGSALEFVPFEESQRARLEAIIERTYVGTLDCPTLDGTRSTHDVLAGYRESGEYRPERWSIACHSRHDVGCLLLTADRTATHWELVYMGLAPEVRGRSLGNDLIRRAQWQAGAGGATLLVAAVDALNQPALRGYVAAGFSAWDRRTVFIKKFKS